MGGELNTRRKLVIALGAGALTAPFGAFAQQQRKVWRVGVLSGSFKEIALDTFVQSMHDLGYIEGKNLTIESRSTRVNAERLPGLASELMQLKLDVIVVGGTPPTLALQRATTTIPIVMVNVADPVGNGLVKSLRHPGGNITGTSQMLADLVPKGLEMLISMAHKATRVAVLLNPANLSHAIALKNVKAATKRLGVTILGFEARTQQEIDNVFSEMQKKSVGVVMVVLDAFFIQQRHQLAELALNHRLPSVSSFREFAEAGVLMSYGPNLLEQYRRAATYLDKIFKGAKPADLPVEQPTKFELFINGKTAKALGLKIPQSLLIMADKVIE